MSEKVDSRNIAGRILNTGRAVAVLGMTALPTTLVACGTDAQVNQNNKVEVTAATPLASNTPKEGNIVSLVVSSPSAEPTVIASASASPIDLAAKTDLESNTGAETVKDENSASPAASANASSNPTVNAVPSVVSASASPSASAEPVSAKPAPDTTPTIPSVKPSPAPASSTAKAAPTQQAAKVVSADGPGDGKLGALYGIEGHNTYEKGYTLIWNPQTHKFAVTVTDQAAYDAFLKGKGLSESDIPVSSFQILPPAIVKK